MRLVNLGIGHGAADAGAGYADFDPRRDTNFAPLRALPNNPGNPPTNDQNDVDFHLDGAASLFLSKQSLAGVVGSIMRSAVTADRETTSDVFDRPASA
jgi:hypothetical protein